MASGLEASAVACQARVDGKSSAAKPTARVPNTRQSSGRRDHARRVRLGQRRDRHGGVPPLKRITPLEISGPLPGSCWCAAAAPRPMARTSTRRTQDALLGPTEPMILTIFCCIVHVG